MNNITKLHLPLAMLLILTACQSNQSAAEKAVKEVLKDPDSAKFGAFYWSEKTGYGCLTVNAKNSMGGYTGDKQALVSQKNDKWAVLQINDALPESCQHYTENMAD